MDNYKGILFDIEELPYFRKIEGTVPGMEKETTVLEAHEKKMILERDILNLIQIFERETALRIARIEISSLEIGSDKTSQVRIDARL